MNNIILSENEKKRQSMPFSRLILKKHKTEVFGILAALNGKTPAEIGRQNILVTGAQIRAAVKDKELINFIKSCASGESE